MLLYSLTTFIWLWPYKEDLEQFRQDGSLTPGHPEYGHTVGVEATTGPRCRNGYGIGMAMASTPCCKIQ